MARNHELPQEGGPDGDGGQDGHGMEVADDGSSLMLCSPLIPQRDSLVEIAETEYVSFNEAGRVAAEGYRSPLHQVHTIDDIDQGSESEDHEGESEAHLATTGSDKGEGSSRIEEGGSVGNNTTDGEGQPSDTSKSVFRWPWLKTEEEKRVEQEAKEERKQVEAKAKEELKLKKKNEKLMWVPSPTKISLQTMWWGYRMSVNFSTAGSVAN